MKRVVILALASLGFAACGSKSTSSPTTPTATATRVIGLSGNLAFGNVPVGSSTTATLTISNSGNAVLTVSAITASGGMSNVLLGDWLSGTIAPGTSQPVTVQFAPSAAQAYSGVITVVSDATSGTNTLNASGTGTTVTPTAVPGYYLWGGPGYSQYLGFFTCVFCVEFDANSVNNQFGQYGSQFASTSIRNQFSQFGSAFSNNSACNQFASNPPRVFNSNGSVYYGELTLNQFRADAIKATTIVTWLTTNVCKHQATFLTERPANNALEPTARVSSCERSAERARRGSARPLDRMDSSSRFD
jgi:hypothetical protein